MSDRALRGVSQMLCTAGIGISGYLTYVHYAGLRPVCGISHGCETVQTSAVAALLGIPVALLGLITDVVIFVSLRLRGERPLLVSYALTLIAFAFSVYSPTASCSRSTRSARGGCQVRSSSPCWRSSVAGSYCISATPTSVPSTREPERDARTTI